MVYLDTDNNTLLYVVDSGDQLGKVVVRVNYNQKGQFDGVRARITSNFVITGGEVLARDLKAQRYKLLKGG